MATASIPYSFTNGFNADATQVNSNFNTLATFLNTEVVQRDGTVAFTGIPTLPSTNPSTANHAVRKGYVDAFFPVTSANIADGTIVAADIAAATITKDKFSASAGQLGGAWTPFTQSTARTIDYNLSSISMSGSYLMFGKTCMFRLRAEITVATSNFCAIGLPSVIGSGVDDVQPINAVITVGGLNRKSATARFDDTSGARVRLYSDVDGNGFTAGQIVTVTMTGTVEVA